jgi:hypothetical protein
MVFFADLGPSKICRCLSLDIPSRISRCADWAYWVLGTFIVEWNRSTDPYILGNIELGFREFEWSRSRVRLMKYFGGKFRDTRQ